MKLFLKSIKILSRFVGRLQCNVSTALMLLMLCCFQPAFATPTTPTSDFIDNGDGTVTHKLTGLMWMRCSAGQMWTGSTCEGTAATYTWNQAMALKSNFAGKSDWRLPNIAELQTIVEREAFNPAINTSIFPNTPNSRAWSSSPLAYYGNYAWFLDFYSGGGYSIVKYDSFFVRLVRGGQSFGFLPLTTPNTDFVDNNDGTVTHKRTGLVWQRCSVGQTWTGTTCSGSATAYTRNAAMALKSNFAGKTDWRVPNQNELLSIAEYGKYDPAINTTMFPNTTTYWFRSSSPDASNSNYAWIVSFYDGNGSYGVKGSSYFVRLVRGGQCSFCFLSLDVNTQSATSLDFGINYDAKYSQTVELKNTSANPIKISNVLVSDARNYWINLFIDSKPSCRAKHTAPDSKSFTIPAQSSCAIGIGFSPFDTLTAGKPRKAVITLKTVINGIATDKVINVKGIGRAKVATLYTNSNGSLYGQWGVTQLKGGNPPLNAFRNPKTWYSEVTDKTLQKLIPHVGNVVVFAGNSDYPMGYVGVVIQTKPVLTMLTTINSRNQNGDIVRQWQVKPVNWFPIKNNAATTWQPFITGVGTTSDKHYGFIDWNSSLY